MLIERRTEHLITRLVEMSERNDRKGEEMEEMRSAFDKNHSETISFLTQKFRQEFDAQEAEHWNILTQEEVEFDSLTQDLSEQNAELHRRVGEAVQALGSGQTDRAPEGSFPRGTAPTRKSSPASLRTDFTGGLPDPFQVPDEIKDLFARHARPPSSRQTTPREERAASSKDVPVAAVENPSPESLLVKALLSMMNKGYENGKPKTKEAETIKLLDC